VLGAQDQPSARGIEAVDSRQIEGHPLISGQFQGAQPPIEFSG